jgi:hypothetical protein
MFKQQTGDAIYVRIAQLLVSAPPCGTIRNAS